MKYNPQIHHRQSLRLKGYDYSQAGAYFITICCEKMAHRFGKITTSQQHPGQTQGIAPLAIVRAGFTPARSPAPALDHASAPKMQLNEFGQIAYNEWIKLSERFKNFELDVFQIMPNHMHGIIVLNDLHSYGKQQGKSFPVATARITPANNHTIGDIIGAYKSLVANECLKIYKSRNQIMGKLWQRNYHERIIRNEQSYQNISEYIINNPSKWQEDKFYTKLKK